jgi:hypothetical protein
MAAISSCDPGARKSAWHSGGVHVWGYSRRGAKVHNTNLTLGPAMHHKERGGVNDRVRFDGGAGFEMCAAEVGLADTVGE